MTPELPAALRGAVEAALHGLGRRDLSERAAKVSETYRGGEGSAVAIGTEADALAYALARMPATYAACAAVFAEAARLAPDFSPASMLDAGAGPGVAGWAALETWSGLSGIVQLDSNTPFLMLAERLSAAGGPVLEAATRVRADLAQPQAPADLVVASYALAEIASGRQAEVVEALWSASRAMLILVEPGTPAGFERSRAARAQLIAQGASALAPCPHDLACPIVAPDWCHFVQRLPRSRDHRLAKGAEAPFEDEKFAYVVAVRSGVAVQPRTPRVLAPPRAGKPGIELKLCVDGVIERRFVARRDKAAHAVARRLDWGDAL